MKVVCEHHTDCGDETCPHAQPHESGPGCASACDEVADARCVVDVAGLPEFRDHGKVAIMIWRRKKAA